MRVFLRLLILNVAILPSIQITMNAHSGEAGQCITKSAESCFDTLFAHMPICSEMELNFRCHHFNVLDACFREHNTICSPTTIGQLAKTSYRHRIVMCARQAQKKYRDASGNEKTVPILFRHQPPSELQFISLFGYLQNQCLTVAKDNCTEMGFIEMNEVCESEIRQRSHHINNDLDRHQLLRVKLDASSRLLPYPETRRADECLMIRSSLSDIFLIHQKYCLQSVITRCMCERLNFEYFCGIECANLQPQTLPFDQTLSWEEFRGRLISAAALPLRHTSLYLSVFALILLRLML